MPFGSDRHHLAVSPLLQKRLFCKKSELGCPIMERRLVIPVLKACIKVVSVEDAEFVVEGAFVHAYRIKGLSIRPKKPVILMGASITAKHMQSRSIAAVG